jgi:hypothetical protein
MFKVTLPFIKCGVTAEEEIRDDHSPNWYVIVVMELTI